MPFDNLSQRERNCLEDVWQMENLNIAKFSAYAEQCGDQNIKLALADIARTKRHHVSKIKQLLG